jgi:hypothetical protein
VPVFVRSECPVGEVLRSSGCGSGRELDDALAAIAAAGCGVIVYLRRPASHRTTRPASGRSLVCGGRDAVDLDTPRMCSPISVSDRSDCSILCIWPTRQGLELTHRPRYRSYCPPTPRDRRSRGGSMRIGLGFPAAVPGVCAGQMVEWARRARHVASRRWPRWDRLGSMVSAANATYCARPGRAGRPRRPDRPDPRSRGCTVPATTCSRAGTLRSCSGGWWTSRSTR